MRQRSQGSQRRQTWQWSEAKASGADATDYTTSPTARSFVPYYAQRLSAASVLNGARGIQKSLKKRAAKRRPHEAGEEGDDGCEPRGLHGALALAKLCAGRRVARVTWGSPASPREGCEGGGRQWHAYVRARAWCAYVVCVGSRVVQLSAVLPR